MDPAERRASTAKPRATVKKTSPAKPSSPKAVPGKARTGRGRAGVRKAFKATTAKSVKVRRVESFERLTAAHLLGVRPYEDDEALSPMEWVSVIRQGVPSRALDDLSEALSVSKAELSGAIDISLRTLQRRRRASHLDSDETGKLVRVARVFERAEEVFENPDAARAWLKTPNAALSGQTPMSLFDTEIGAQSVLDTLGRIEHGVFA